MESLITNDGMNEIVFFNKKEKIEESLRTTYKKKIWRNFVKAIKDFNLIEDGDKIAVGVSGGKDSLLLCKLFQELKKDRSNAFSRNDGECEVLIAYLKTSHS